MSVRGFLRQTNGMNNADATRLRAQLKYAVTIENSAIKTTAWTGLFGLDKPLSRSSERKMGGDDTHA